MIIPRKSGLRVLHFVHLTALGEDHRDNHHRIRKSGVLGQFSAEGDGKPTVMRYIIRDQAGMTDYWEGE